MPTAGSRGEYQALYTAYSSATEGQAAAFRAALSTPLSGYFQDGLAYFQDRAGSFWSSTKNDGSIMYSLGINSLYVYPTGIDGRFSGLSMRCLLGS